MKRFILFFTLIITLINTQLLSYGEVSRISGDRIYYSDGSFGRISGDRIYNSDGSFGRISGDRIYSNRNTNNQNNKEEEEEEEQKRSSSSSSSALPSYNSSTYKLYPILIDKKDIQDSYKERTETFIDGTIHKEIISIKVKQLDNGYQVIKTTKEKIGFPSITHKEYITLVPYNDDKFKVIKKESNIFLWFKTVLYKDNN